MASAISSGCAMCIIIVTARTYVLLTVSASARELGFQVSPSDATKGLIPLSPRAEFLFPRLGHWKILLQLRRQKFRPI